MKEYNNEKAVISLTSWKARINTVELTIKSLLEQCPEFHIVLTLSEDEFPNKELPQSLINLSDKFEILWIKENIKCFKKILFAMDKYRHVPIIAADDDCIYKENYAQKLYNEWVNCNKLHQIYSYHVDANCWPLRFQHGPAVLYPPFCFNEFGLRCLTLPIVNTLHDDIYYGVLAFKLRVPIVEINKNVPYIFHDEIDALSSGHTMNGGVCISICMNEIKL